MQKSTEIMLTPQQRLAAYQWAAENLLRHEETPFVCLILRDWMARNIENFDPDLHDTLAYFPEFKAQKPYNRVLGERWWPLHTNKIPPRIAALQAAIELCNDQIKENGQNI